MTLSDLDDQFNCLTLTVTNYQTLGNVARIGCNVSTLKSEIVSGLQFEVEKTIDRGRTDHISLTNDLDL